MGGRPPRAALAVAIVTAFFLGVLVGPVAGVERRTVVLAELSRLGMPNLVDAGWVVVRTDRDMPAHVGTLVTMERPLVVGWWKAAGDTANDLGRWLQWANGSGPYARR